MEWKKFWERIVETWNALMRERRKGIPSDQKTIIVPMNGKRRMLWIAEQNAKRRHARH